MSTIQKPPGRKYYTIRFSYKKKQYHRSLGVRRRPAAENLKDTIDLQIKKGEIGFLMWHVAGPDNSGYRPYHQACMVRMTLGSVSHLQKKCSCFGGTDPEEDPPGTTKREAAEMALAASRGQKGLT